MLINDIGYDPVSASSLFTEETTMQSQDSGSTNDNEDSNMSFLDQNTQDFSQDSNDANPEMRLGTAGTYWACFMT